MRLRIEICLDNAAFEDDLAGEVKRILGTVPKRIYLNAENSAKLRDSNGNTVGVAEVVEE